MRFSLNVSVSWAVSNDSTFYDFGVSLQLALPTLLEYLWMLANDHMALY